jgi:hypothetical protein
MQYNWLQTFPPLDYERERDCLPNALIPSRLECHSIMQYHTVLT